MKTTPGEIPESKINISIIEKSKIFTNLALKKKNFTEELNFSEENKNEIKPRIADLSEEMFDYFMDSLDGNQDILSFPDFKIALTEAEELGNLKTSSL